MRFRPVQAAHRRSLANWVLAGSLALVWIAAANAQRPMQTDEEDIPAKSSAKTGKGAKGAKTKQPANESLKLETKDGVLLHVDYLPGMISTEEAQKAGIKKPEECVPVILLHMAKGSGADWRPLARSLQRMGCAVIIPDLRGHGQSTQVKRGGATLTIDQATMRRADDFEAMVTQDMEAVKKFVIEKNNKGELNLRKLCVVGAEMGAAVAINWAAADWSWPPLATGPQGQDVNGLVLLTPVWSHKGMTIVNATKHADVQRSISVMILVGNKDSNGLNDAAPASQSFSVVPS